MKMKISLLFLYVGALISVTYSQSRNAKLAEIEFSVTQNIVPVLIGKKDNPVIRIQIPVNTNTDKILSCITIQLSGTTDIKDLQSLKLYYTGSSAAFATKNVFAVAQPASGLIEMRGSQLLPRGNHYIWLSVELNAKVDLQHVVDAVVSSITLDNQRLTSHADFAKGVQRIGIALRNAGDDKVASYRIPGLATTNNGTLLAVYDIRYNSGVDLQEDIDVGMNRSVDGGQTWEPMKIVMDAGTYGGKPKEQNGIGDPSILVDTKTGDTWVAALWLHGYPKQRAWNASQPGLEPEKTGQFMLAKSSDDGKTWSDLINITKQVKDSSWQLCFQGPGKGITMEDGTLVFPAQFKDANLLPHSTIIYSKDHGSTWHIGTAAYPNTTEAQVIETTPGVLMLNMRDNRGGTRSIYTTTDLGATWKEHPSNRKALIESVCNASLIKHEYNGKTILFFANPNATDGRHHMTIKASLDMGLTWPIEKQLLLDELSGAGYPSLTSIDKNHIGILYEGSQANLVFEKIDLKEILH